MNAEDTATWIELLSRLIAAGITVAKILGREDDVRTLTAILDSADAHWRAVKTPPTTP